MPTYADSPSGLALPRVYATAGGRADALAVALLEARLAQLELQLQEQGWQRLAGERNEFTRDGIGKIAELARVTYLKNPLVNRAVEVASMYVWGQDISVRAADRDVQALVDRFWTDNRGTLTGQQASRLMEVELQVTGNVFLALFPDGITGAVRVRLVPLEEVRDITGNPQDRAEPWFYRREWQERPSPGAAAEDRVALHPDWRYRPDDRPASIDGVEVRWDAPLCHVKAGAFAGWRWGVPEIYAALDWARAYKEQLEDDATRSRALARFAWRVTTNAGAAGVQAATQRLGSTLGTGLGGETNPAPAAGSAFVGDKSVGLDPIRLAGSTLDPDHSRPARLMASAALGIPDHFFDADVGNFATSKTLDRPTELRFAERRQLWRDVLGELIQWAIDADLAATRGVLPKALAEDARAVDLAWPDLLEPDVEARVRAVAVAAPYLPDELTARLMMTALGVEDVDGELAKLAPAGDPASPTEAKRSVPELATVIPADVLDRARKAWRDAVGDKHAGLLDAVVAP